MPEESINYDRAADFYDATRSYPEGIAEQIAEFIAQKALLKPDTSLLEVGIGTGHVAVPLSAHVGTYTGVDISGKMMAKLREKQAATAIRLALADAENLPFASRSIKHVLVSHVLHLVADPERALSEIARVMMRPGQLLYLNAFHELPEKFNIVLGEWRKHRKSGKQSAFERARTEEFFDPNDWYKMEEYRLTYPSTENPKYFLDAIQNRWWSNMWELSDVELEIAYLAIERVTKEQFGENYDIEIPIISGIDLKIFVPKRA